MILCVNVDKDLWKEGSPKPAELKSESVHDYYEILEELGTWVTIDVE